MVKKHVPDPPNLKKYGVPLYSVAWIPQSILKSLQNVTTDDDHSSDDAADHKSSPETEAVDAGKYLVFAGGGGDSRSGIPNSVLLAHFDVVSDSLSDPPVFKLGTNSELPYRMALHPNGEGIICAMEKPKCCRWFDWDQNEDAEIHKLGLKVSEKLLTQLDNVGQQLALAFNNDGTTLAAGGEDGSLRVFKWPSMENILNESNAHSTVKDLHFSSDGKLIVSLGGGGPCRVWDVSSAIVLATLANENRENFSSCRFSQTNDGTQVLYIAARTDKGFGSIVTWNTQTWERISSKHILRDPICAFNVSADGKFLACGTPEGDIVIVNSTNMQIQTMIKKAHLGVVTALAFSPDSRALASVSMDSSARVTIIEEKKNGGGLSLWIAIFIFLLAIAASFLKVEGIEKLKLQYYNQL
ncbi:putative transcription factor WD40-like family [Medicago truncatula]|uniref:Putative transcription factor WD40-like family n=1 Tax=Medicago truncatula TaxID=3880 RepID=A0A072UND0_MEDTR|nr:SEC12-like protein 2 [Medicago truncatula]KEH30851.1 SEC12p-like protein [Medicago truncatula]RHN62123.1 putative transcription factor WD40-like family [Medicago truncatula]